jgi:hypothetical protein
MRLLRAALALTLSVYIAGCAHQSWVAGPNAQGTFNEAKGRCMLLANNTGGGFYAQGSQSFVASAAAGAAIGSAIKAASNFDACMMANGWEIANEGRTPAPTSYASANSNTTAPNANFSAVPPVPTPNYTGDLKNGRKEGHGTATYVDGSKYVGEFKNDVRSGYGVWTNARGDRYEGEWANDKRQGSGTYTDINGAVSRGIWQEGEFVKHQAIEPVSTAPVSATAASSNTGQVSSTAFKPMSAPVASSRTRSGKAIQRKPISATAAALSAASPPKLALPNPSPAPPATLSDASSSTSTAACTHEQQVQARIAKMNGYTAGPKCD